MLKLILNKTLRCFFDRRFLGVCCVVLANGTFGTLLCGQHRLGVANSNNAGIVSLDINPANVADNRYWMDIHVGSVSLNVNQNLFRSRFGLIGILKNDSSIQSLLLSGSLFLPGISGRRYAKGSADLLRSYEKRPQNMGLYGSSEIMGPSIMFTPVGRIGIAFTTKARFLFDIFDRHSGSDVNILEQYDVFLSSPNKLAEVQQYRMGDMKSAAHAFGEFNLTVGAPVMDKGVHFLKAGLTVKRLIGFAYNIFRSLRATIDLNPDRATLGSGTIGFQGYMENIAYKNPYRFRGVQDYANYFLGGVFGSKDIPTGWGFDLGFVYEYRPDYHIRKLYNAAFNMSDKYVRDIEDYTKNKYLFKWSTALKDFGYIRYPGEFSGGFYYDTEQKVVAPSDINPNLIFTSQYQKVVDQIQKALTPADFEEDIKQEITFYLPATFVTQLDWAVYKKWYLNASLFANLLARYDFNTRTPTVFALTPRYETERWDVSFPVIYNFFYNQLKVGLGLNWGSVFYAGMDDIGIVFGRFRGFNAYMGFRVPMRKRKPFVRVFDQTHKMSLPNPYAEPRREEGNSFKDIFKRNALEKENPVLYNKKELRKPVPAKSK